MKKSIIIFAVFLLMNVMYIPLKAASLDTLVSNTKNVVIAAKDSVVQEIREVDTSSTFKMMYSDFKSGITALASSLKVGAEHVYEVLVRQQIVYAIVYIIFFIFAWILIIIWIKKYKDKDEEWDDANFITGLGIIRVLQILLGIILLLIGIFHIDTIITGFVNPEYGALQDVIDMVKTIK